MSTVIIKTASWFTPLPEDHQRIGISRGVPRRTPAGYRRYTALNPGPWFNKVSAEEYVRRYQSEVLAKLDPRRVIEDLQALSAGRTPTLLCYENAAPGPDWCHRGLVSQWLHHTLGVEVFEYGQEDIGCGKRHPKIPQT